MSTPKVAQNPAKEKPQAARKEGRGMAVRQIKIRGVKRWQARVAYRGARLSRLCSSKDEAKQAEADLLRTLVKAAEQETQANATPATLEMLFEAYMLDLEARGKTPESIKRVRESQRRLTDFFGSRMKEPLGKLTEADLYAFRAARLRGGVKPGTINRDFITLRAMLKEALPHFRFPAGLFFPEDETRVRWLEPIQETATRSAWCRPRPRASWRRGVSFSGPESREGVAAPVETS